MTPSPTDPERHRFYGDLAEWWPLLSPAEEYAEEAAYLLGLLRSGPGPTRDVLELGSGGGHVAVHLAGEVALTLVDLSDEMLAASRRINPGCEHRQGDMRTVRLGRSFDAVFIYDAIDYMVTEDDLRAALTTAHVHCRPGGVAVFVPDDTCETFEPSTDTGGGDGADGRAARLFSWSWADPEGASTTTVYAFVLRDADGRVRVVHETHRCGLFGRDQWLRLLAEAGFAPEVVTEATTEDRPPRQIFVGHRPVEATFASPLRPAGGP